MTNFGFNTDIKFGDTVYHVQSEERRYDSQLQTQIFVRGRCIGKYSSVYASTGDEGARDQSAIDESLSHELLKAQHRLIVEAVRAGKIEEMLAQQACTTESEMTEVATSSEVAAVDCEPAKDAEAAEAPRAASLELHFLNPRSVFVNDRVTLHFAVMQDANPIAGVKITCRFQAAQAGAGEAAPIYSHAVSSDEGFADIEVQTTESALPQASLLVQASHNGMVVTRKYKLTAK